MTTRQLISILGACTLLYACGSGEDPKEYAKKQNKEQLQARPRSQIKTIKTPVAVGAKVNCADWIDLAKFQEALGEEGELTLDDKSKTEVDPTSICSIKKGGEPPSEAEQAKMYEKGMKIGVVGGDEVCLAHLFCGYIATEEDMRKKCESDPLSEMNESLGQPACVHKTQRAAKWAYRYSLIDPDTTCGLDVQGGPSITDEEFVQKCARATLDSLVPGGIAKPYMP